MIPWNTRRDASKVGAISQLILTAGLLLNAPAAEYFVSQEGAATNRGLSRVSAFATVQQGVDALQPGDTLTILPGEYFGSVRRDGLGDSNAVTTIRADIIGTVVLRGDVPIKGLHPIENHRFVYGARLDVDRAVQAVNELDTLMILDQQPSIAQVVFTPGTFCHDQAAGWVYLSTRDLASPTARHYSASVNDSHGLYLAGAQRVVIEGLAVTGFNTNRQRDGGEGTHGGVYGIFLYESADCTIRDCRAWLNAQGIGISSGQHATRERLRGGNTIERCTAWANASQYGWGDMGGLTIFHGRGDTIRDSLSFRNAGYGANIYNTADGLEESDANRNRLIGTIAWGNGLADLKIKAEPWHVTERCVGGFGSNILNPIHCLFRRPYASAGSDSIQLEVEENLDPYAEFADPDNRDYRLQPTSRFRGTSSDGSDRGPFPYAANIFYVKTNGNDTAEGLSVSTAWKTFARAVKDLKSGDTLYLCGGRYAAAEVGTAGTSDLSDRGAVGHRGQPSGITIRGRGLSVPVLEGPLTVSGSVPIVFERIEFAGSVKAPDAVGVRFENSRFTGGPVALSADSTADLRVEHCEFRPSVAADLPVRCTQTGGDRGLCLEITGATPGIGNPTAGLDLRGNWFDNTQGVAVVMDDIAVITYAGYNGYADTRRAWQVAGQPFTDRNNIEHSTFNVQRPTSNIEHRTQNPQLRTQNSQLRTQNSDGPFGRPAGPHRDEAPPSSLRLHGPIVHSTSDTTANFEWWLSDLARLEISWGTDAGALTNAVRRDSNLFGSFSLTGLEPGTCYFFRIKTDRPFEHAGGTVALEREPDHATVTFQTASAPERPRVYHVAPDGGDHHDGRARQRAWQTVQHAAGHVGPGDTVMIHGGTYRESVRVRATGEAGRPIAFRAAPGEKVVFDGLMRTLDFVFLAQDKSHIRFDGFYFVGYAHGSDRMPWRINARGNRMNGCIVLLECGDVQVTRCFADGRGPGYAPGLLHAYNCPDLLVQNNVMLRCMGRLTIRYLSPRARVQNNVFLVNLIRHFGYHPRGARHIMDSPERPLIEANIFTDNLLSKRNVPIALSDTYTTHRDNCFYLRVPAAQRVWLDENSFADMLAGRETGDYTQVADPCFKGTLERKRADTEGNPVFLGDYLLSLSDLDFPDLFATSPELVEHGIGLQPEAFEDFHFNKRFK